MTFSCTLPLLFNSYAVKRHSRDSTSERLKRTVRLSIHQPEHVLPRYVSALQREKMSELPSEYPRRLGMVHVRTPTLCGPAGRRREERRAIALLAASAAPK